MFERVSYPKPLTFLACAVLCVLICGSLAFPPKLQDIRAVSSVVVDKDGQSLSAFTLHDGIWRMPVSLKNVDEKFITRLIAIEDQRFYSHSGVDFIAIIRAGRGFFQNGKAVSGASTITMQLVRLIEPRPRTLPSKIIESFRALQLELFLSKSEILEAYLTHAPYGGNIEGLESASRAYFGKSPKRLTDAEIALLIALPQAPEARRPDLRPRGAKTGRAIILKKLRVSGHLSPRLVDEANIVPLPLKRQPVPELAWITTYGLAKPNAVTQTTLDRALQTDLENVASRYVSSLERPVNTAITIVDNKTMSVRAHIASADRSRPGGWIDMTEKSRSPGSTLKPFVYAMAIDDGLISTASILQDRPTRFGSYQPENFNRRYHGNVRVFEALRHSLNVPAVAVLEKVGGQRFEDSLINAGIKITRRGNTEEQAGLALALGGAGMNVNDLAVLYAALANGGNVAPLRWLEQDVSKERRLLSETTASEITDILRQAPTPSGRVPGWLSQDAPPIAYKTGTSYGFRDAWAAGYTKDWTVIVWVGRPDGAPRPGQTGRLAAAPLLFDVFALLPQSKKDQVFIKDHDAPEGLQSLAQRYETGPQIIFPPDKAELYAPTLGAQARGFTLSGQSDLGDLQFYVDGLKIERRQNRFVWRPDSAGFYTVTAINADGQQAESNVQVVTQTH